MTAPPLVAPPEAQPSATPEPAAPLLTESLSRPFRLGLAGLGVTVGLSARLLAANSFGELNSQPSMLAAAATSALVGLALLLMAAERDRFGAPLVWLSAITAAAWGTLNWISPPFAPEVTMWSNPDQAVLGLLGVGNGLLLAGIVVLAFVRRHPTLSVAATLLAGVFVLASSTVVLREEWPAIVALGIAFALVLLAWDRSPRRELAFKRPNRPPRVSRAALSLVSVALCGTAIQLWLSRMEIPRALPAVAGCAVLVVAAFASLIRVRREIEQRETTLSEWTSWMREIRTNDFRAEMANFESPASDEMPDAEEAKPLDADGQAPRPLSFPNLVIPDAAPDEPRPMDNAINLDVDLARFSEVDAEIDLSGISLDPNDDLASADSTPSTISGLIADTAPAPQSPEIIVPSAAATLPRIDLEPTEEPAGAELVDATSVSAAAVPRTGGAFSALLVEPEPDAETAEAEALEPKADGVAVFGLDAFSAWLGSPAAAARQQPLIVAIEAMSLSEFDSLPADDAAMATDEIGSYLAELMPTADLVSWIDGPYFIVAHASKSDSDLLTLNKDIRKALKATAGVLAFIRPVSYSTVDEVVDQAVIALLRARIAEQHAAGI